MKSLYLEGLFFFLKQSEYQATGGARGSKRIPGGHRGEGHPYLEASPLFACVNNLEISPLELLFWSWVHVLNSKTLMEWKEKEIVPCTTSSKHVSK